VFGKYALPSDDLAGTATAVTVGGIGSPAAEADPEYLATNLIAPSNTGHRNLPSRPAKLTAYQGYWELTFAAPISVGAYHIVYPNFDAGLDVTLEPDGGTPIPVICPALFENGWWKSPWAEFDAQSSDTWRLSINAANSLLPQVGRLLLYANLRQMANDVLWGDVEDEDLRPIEHRTEGGVEILYEMGGPRRSFDGQFGLKNATTPELVTLHRSARNRILPWTLIPDEDVNDAWFVRFVETRWTRNRAITDHDLLPFRVQELSRGLVFP
jgi:hypothetical protein